MSKDLSTYYINPQETALLVVDFQQSFTKVMPDLEQQLNNCRILIETANRLNMPILVTEQYPKGLGHTVDQLMPYLDKADFYEKVQFSAWLDPIEKKLTDHKIKHLIIAGVETHVCIFQTSRDLLANGYHVTLAGDATTSRTDANRLNGLEMIQAMGGVTANTESIILNLIRTAAIDDFKFFSSLIK